MLISYLYQIEWVNFFIFKSQFQYDIASLNFPTVSNNNADAGTDSDESAVQIDFCGVVLKTDWVDDTTDYMSAGAEYNNQQDVWVGMASIMYKGNGFVSICGSFWVSFST